MKLRTYGPLLLMAVGALPILVNAGLIRQATLLPARTEVLVETLDGATLRIDAYRLVHRLAGSDALGERLQAAAVAMLTNAIVTRRGGPGGADWADPTLATAVPVVSKTSGTRTTRTAVGFVGPAGAAATFNAVFRPSGSGASISFPAPLALITPSA